jgi:hypothetical protein
MKWRSSQQDCTPAGLLHLNKKEYNFVEKGGWGEQDHKLMCLARAAPARAGGPVGQRAATVSEAEGCIRAEAALARA